MSNRRCRTKEHVPQLKIDNRIKETGVESEMVIQEFSLKALLRLAADQGFINPDAIDAVVEQKDVNVCVLSNIPDEESDRAVTYVKVFQAREDREPQVAE